MTQEKPRTGTDDTELADSDPASTDVRFEELLRDAARVSSHRPRGPATPPIGASLAAGRFSILRRLGEGGMGVVYEAFDRERNSRVALKTVHQLDSGSLYQLKNEFRALADVAHPCLVGLHELFAEGESWYFTMDLVDGVPFDAWVRSKATGLDLPRLRSSLQQLSAAVGAIHASGKLHRDLKPSNVLVTPDGRVVVLDFGLAADPELGGVGHTIADDHVCGTPAYMAPEQAAGAPATAASDLYAIGVMLFEALTGRLPFEGGLHEILVDKQRREPNPPSGVARDVPPDLDRLCVALLARNPASRPALPELTRQLVADAPEVCVQASSNRVTADPVRVVGREPELARLQVAFEAACAGKKPVVVLLAGESGIGKSALAGAFLSQLRADGRALVLSGRCYERESVPFKAFDVVVDELSRHLRRLTTDQVSALLPRDTFALRTLFPVLGRIGPIAEAPSRDVADVHELRRRAFSAFGELLGRIRDRQPLVVHLDDLQWSDADSTVLLMHLVRQPDAPHLLLIASHRSEQMRKHPHLSPLYDELPVDIRLEVQQIALGPLPDAAARELLSAHVGEAHAQLLADAGGNPFLIGELARHAAAHPIDQAKSLSLHALLQTRVRTLSREDRELLEVLAVAGRPIALGLAANAAGGGDGPRSRFESLQNQHLARSTGDGAAVESFHDKVRETVLGELDAEQLRARHRSLARVLSEVDDVDPEQLAGHLLGAGERERAAEQFVRAADRAAAELGFDRAARLYAQALEHGNFASEPAQRLRVARAEALAEAGRGAASAEAYLQALEAAAPAEAVALRQRAAEQYLYGGELERGLEHLTAALSPLGIRVPTSTPEILASVLYHDARLRLRKYRWSGAPSNKPEAARRIDALRRAADALLRIDMLRGAEFGLRCSLLELTSGTESDASIGLSRLMFVESMVGKGPDTIAKTIDRAERFAASSTDPLVHGYRDVFLSCTFSGGALADPDLALAHLEQSIARLSQRALPATSYNLNLCEWLRALTCASVGQLAKTAAELPAHLDDAWNRSDICLIPLWCHVSAISDLAVGNDAGLERAIAKIFAVWSARQMTFQEMNVSQARVRLGRYRRQIRATFELADQLLQRTSQSPMSRSVFMDGVRRDQGLSIAALAAELPEGSERAALLQRLARTQRATREPFTRSVLEAASACANGDAPQAIAALRLALRSPAWRVDANAARRRLGILIGGDEGKALVAEAHAFFEAGGVVDIEHYADHVVMPGLTIR